MPGLDAQAAGAGRMRQSWAGDVFIVVSYPRVDQMQAKEMSIARKNRGPQNFARRTWVCSDVDWLTCGERQG